MLSGGGAVTPLAAPNSDSDGEPHGGDPRGDAATATLCDVHSDSDSCRRALSDDDDDDDDDDDEQNDDDDANDADDGDGSTSGANDLWPWLDSATFLHATTRGDVVGDSGITGDADWLLAHDTDAAGEPPRAQRRHSGVCSDTDASSVQPSLNTPSLSLSLSPHTLAFSFALTCSVAADSSASTPSSSSLSSALALLPRLPLAPSSSSSPVPM
jgi:hypothetical protein